MPGVVPVLELVPVQGPVRAPEPELVLVPVQELVPVPVLARGPVRAREPELELVLVAGLALALCRKRESKSAARCRPGSGWQCC